MKTPQNEAELSELVADAKGPFSIRGGGTRGISVQGEVLSTSGLAGISLYEPGALTIVAGAGTPLSEVEAALAAENQRLPFEPMDHRSLLGTTGEPTIGGVVAANVSGPRRIQVGACRDALIGVRFVDGHGKILKNGGRVMKNVTGYDLVKLMAGSFGTLGVLSEVAFKVLPRPESVAVLLLEGLTDADAIEALSIALGSPFEVSGAAHLQVGLDGAPVTMVRIEGFDASVGYRAEQLTAVLARFGNWTVERDPDRVTAGWRHVRDVEAFSGRDGDVWRVSVKPSDGPDAAAAVAAFVPDVEVMYDWGGGLLWLMVPEGTDIRPALSGFAGHATLVRAGEAARAQIPIFQPETATLTRLASAMRDRFDPHGVFNPGLMG